MSTIGYMPKGSGMLREGGQRGGKARRNVVRGGSLRHMPDCHISDRATIRQVIPDFDPSLEFEYSKRELLLLTEKILDADPKPQMEEPVFLFASQLRQRSKREIYCSNGVPEPHIVSGMYNRTHPNGRRWRDAERMRETKGSFYR